MRSRFCTLVPNSAAFSASMVSNTSRHADCEAGGIVCCHVKPRCHHQTVAFMPVRGSGGNRCGSAVTTCLRIGSKLARIVDTCLSELQELIHINMLSSLSKSSCQKKKKEVEKFVKSQIITNKWGNYALQFIFQILKSLKNLKSLIGGIKFLIYLLFSKYKTLLIPTTNSDWSHPDNNKNSVFYFLFLKQRR